MLGGGVQGQIDAQQRANEVATLSFWRGERSRLACELTGLYFAKEGLSGFTGPLGRAENEDRWLPYLMHIGAIFRGAEQAGAKAVDLYDPGVTRARDTAPPDVGAEFWFVLRRLEKLRPFAIKVLDTLSDEEDYDSQAELVVHACLALSDRIEEAISEHRAALERTQFILTELEARFEPKKQGRS